MNPKLTIANWMYINLNGGKEECTPPGHRLELKFGALDVEDGEPVLGAVTVNDGYDLLVSYRWPSDIVDLQHWEARQLAWWILWDWWAKATWFGLKRRLWYWALGVRLRSQGWYRAKE